MPDQRRPYSPVTSLTAVVALLPAHRAPTCATLSSSNATGFIKLQRNNTMVAFVSSFVRLQKECDDGQATALGYPGVAPSARVAPALRRGQSRPRTGGYTWGLTGRNRRSPACCCRRCSRTDAARRCDAALRSEASNCWLL